MRCDKGMKGGLVFCSYPVSLALILSNHSSHPFVLIFSAIGLALVSNPHDQIPSLVADNHLFVFVLTVIQ